MRVRVLLFAQLRRLAGKTAVELDLPGEADLGAALEALYARHPELRAHAASCMSAVDLEYAAADRKLREGDEISLIPPVSGG